LDAFDDCFVQLSEWYTKCAAFKGDYFEGQRNNFFPISYVSVLIDQTQELYY
jgi:hypothetical protein